VVIIDNVSHDDITKHIVLGSIIIITYATADEAVAYMFYRCFSCFFSVRKNMRQPFSGTAEQIFMKLLPNDTGENGVCNVVPPPGEC